MCRTAQVCAGEVARGGGGMSTGCSMACCPSSAGVCIAGVWHRHVFSYGMKVKTAQGCGPCSSCVQLDAVCVALALCLSRTAAHLPCPPYPTPRAHPAPHSLSADPPVAQHRFGGLYIIWNLTCRSGWGWNELVYGPANAAAAGSRAILRRVAMELVTVLAWLVALFTLAWPWGVGASRIIDNRHHASDVVGGFVLALTFTPILFTRAVAQHVYWQRRLPGGASGSGAALANGGGHADACGGKHPHGYTPMLSNVQPDVEMGAAPTAASGAPLSTLGAPAAASANSRSRSHVAQPPAPYTCVAPVAESVAAVSPATHTLAHPSGVAPAGKVA